MNTRVRAKPRPSAARTHPNALSVIQHVQQYLAGAQNEEALEAWLLAVGTGLQQGLALDGLLQAMCERWNAAASAAATAEHAVDEATTREERKP